MLVRKRSKKRSSCASAPSKEIASPFGKTALDKNKTICASFELRIWYGSSGYNKRHEKNILCTCDKKYKDIWYEIKSEYYKIVKYLIKNLQ